MQRKAMSAAVLATGLLAAVTMFGCEEKKAAPAPTPAPKAETPKTETPKKESPAPSEKPAETPPGKK